MRTLCTRSRSRGFTLIELALVVVVLGVLVGLTLILALALSSAPGRGLRRRLIRPWILALGAGGLLAGALGSVLVGLGYVLLIGDPSPIQNVVPMLEAHPLAAIIRTYPEGFEEHIDPVPTDYYYADPNDFFGGDTGEDAELRKRTYEESVGWYEGITADIFG